MNTLSINCHLAISCHGQKTRLLGAASLFRILYKCIVVCQFFICGWLLLSHLNWVDTLPFIKKGMLCKVHCIRSSASPCIYSLAFLVINDAECLVDEFWIVMSNEIWSFSPWLVASLLLIKWSKDRRLRKSWLSLPVVADWEVTVFAWCGVRAVVWCPWLILQDICLCSSYVILDWTLPCLIDDEDICRSCVRSSFAILGRSSDSYVQFC